MSALRYITGDPTAWNYLALGTVSYSDQNALFPWTGVVDGVPGTIGQFNTQGSALFVKWDLHLNGNMTTWAGGDPTGYTDISTGTGSVTQDSVTFHGAPSSARLTGGASGVGALRRIYVVRPGDLWKASFRLTNNASGTMDVQIRNLDTGDYLGVGDSWQSSQTYRFQNATTGGAFDLSTATFRIQTHEIVGQDVCTLEVIVRKSTNDNGWVDNWIVIPGADYFSVHGHNVGLANGIAGVLMSGSDDDSAYSDYFDGDALVNPRYPSFYEIIASPEYHQFWRLSYAGTPTSGRAVYYGEIVLSQVQTALAYPHFGYTWVHRKVQTRTTTPGGVTKVYRRALARNYERSLSLNFRPRTDAVRTSFRDDVWVRSDGGAHPSILIPDDTKPEVLFGRFMDSFEAERQFLTIHETDLAFVEEPFPVVIT